jgi:hypothetical protein
MVTLLKFNAHWRPPPFGAIVTPILEPETNWTRIGAEIMELATYCDTGYGPKCALFVFNLTE